MRKKLEKGIRYFIPLSILITGLIGILYIAVQQNYRLSANDPQIQMAQDAVSLLNEGGKPQDIIGSKNIDVSTSLSPFLIIYDKNGKVISSNMILNGELPVLPRGVFSYVDSNSEDRITWQPANGVRVATVVRKYDNGYVLAGRNLRETERRIENLTSFVFIGGLITIMATFISVLIFI